MTRLSDAAIDRRNARYPLCNDRRRPPAGTTGIALVLASALLVAACGGSRVDRDPSSVTVSGPEGAADGVGSGVITSGLDLQDQIIAQQIDSESPFDLAFQADQAEPRDAIILRLRAINGFLAIEDYANAEVQAELLGIERLDSEQQAMYDLARGRIALGFRDNLTALSFLQQVKASPLINDDNRALALHAMADAQIAMGRDVDAIISLLTRDPLLEDVEEQRMNQQRMLNLLRNLDTTSQSTLRQAATRNGLDPNLVSGWLQFAEVSRLPTSDQQSALVSWRNSYPIHPALEELVGGISQLSLETFDHVAMLLPISSRFGTAAQAFYDGFVDAQRADRNIYKPTVSLHDIGEDVGMVDFHYRSAMAEGADFVVGPLGKDAVNRMLDGGVPLLPTLVIGDVEYQYASPDLYGISLSPEPEAVQVAERAFADGHRQAAVFRSAGDWGNRAANAFTRRWEQLGGLVVATGSFPDSIEDYSRIIQRLLEINQSVSREKVLSAQLGTNLEFTPRRRDDIDMMFFAGNARQARLLVPQFRFYQALNLPIYGTSSLFAGDLNPALDADLNGVIFGDMRWMVDIRYTNPDEAIQIDPPASTSDAGDGAVVAQESAPEPALPPVRRRPEPIAKGPYSFSPLDRLYALGMESYYLVPRLGALRDQDWQRYNGQAFNATVDIDGNVVRELDWATFEKGELKRLPPAALPEDVFPGQTLGQTLD